MTISIYWDSQDKSNEGWAYRVIDDGREGSGPYDDLDDNATRQQLADAVAGLDSQQFHLILEEFHIFRVVEEDIISFAFTFGAKQVSIPKLGGVG